MIRAATPPPRCIIRPLTPSTSQRRVLAAAIERCDYFRGTSLSAPGVPGYKEWTYFCVAAPEVDLLLTLGLTGRVGPRSKSDETVGRVIALARDSAGAWYGDADEIPCSAVDVAHGRIGVAMGVSRMRFRSGVYEVDARLASGEISANLRLRPLALPTLGTSVRLGACEPMRWVVVPRLAASGEIEVGGRRHRVESAAGYHDHNWGTFQWGADFAWEWATIPPARLAERWSFVFSRISDRARGRTLSQAILVWRGDESCRTFRDDEIEVLPSGLLRGGARLRVPRVMSIVEPGHTADVPRELTARATRGRDWIEVRLQLVDFAEIAVPNEGSALDTTLLCEARAQATIRGSIRGESVSACGPAVFELNQGATGSAWSASADAKRPGPRPAAAGLVGCPSRSSP
jgi:hypothetical protein